MYVTGKIERLIRLGMSEEEALRFVNDLILQGVAISAVREARDSKEPASVRVIEGGKRA